MASENYYTEKSKHASNNVEAPGQMRGWFKLIETIRKTDPPPMSCESPSPHATLPSPNANGYSSTSTAPYTAFSPPFLSSPSPPERLTPSPPPIPVEPVITRTVAKRSSTRPKRITIRKSTRSKSLLHVNENSHPTEPLPAKGPSVESTPLETTMPLATELQSLPGLQHDNPRDQRFLSYSDTNTLAMHLNASLSVDRKSSSSFHSNKQLIFKTRHNVLNKIFRLDYLKTLQRYCQTETKSLFDEPDALKPTQLSSTAISFQTDWSVNRRQSSSHRHRPRNIFHTLQKNPRKELLSLAKDPLPASSSVDQEHVIDVEQIKNVLLRTYCPQLYSAVEYGYSFGSKCSFRGRHHDFSTDPPADTNEMVAIEPESVKRHGRQSKYREIVDKPLPIAAGSRRVSEEIPPGPMQESTLIIASSQEIPIDRNENDSSSTATHAREDHPHLHHRLKSSLIAQRCPTPTATKTSHLTSYHNEIWSRMAFVRITTRHRQGWT